MANDDASIDRAVDEATAIALGKLRDAARSTRAARDAFDHAVGLASWGSLGDKLARRSGYRGRFKHLLQALDAADTALTRAQDDCRELRRLAGR